MPIDREKYVDESWKETVAQEKQLFITPNEPASVAKPTSPSAGPASEPSTSASNQSKPSPEEQALTNMFLNYVSGLAYQAMIFLGEIPNPMTNLPETNLEQAKFVIDTLAMLRAKTQGNLTKKEEDLLNSSLYELQMKYLDSYQKEQGV